MGRYYYGDINGKFGFATQPSDDFTFFGAEESPYINYVLYNDQIEEAIELTKKLIKEFKAKSPKECKGLNIRTDSDKFWDKYVDQEWYQDQANGLLACRISMGLQIAKFHRENPDDDINIEAEC